MRTESPELALERMFDCFCKKVVRNRNCDLIRHQIRLAAREVPYEQLSAEPFGFDTYSIEDERFDALQDFPVFICDTTVAQALHSLAPSRCKIVLLAYCLSFTDGQIADALGMKRSTVQYQRSKAVMQLRSLLGNYQNRGI